MIGNEDLWATGVPLMSRGVSVLCLDPGETTGWVWALIGHHELLGSGGSDPSGLSGVSRAVWTALMADPMRVRHGEINLWKENRELGGASGSLYHREAAMVQRLGLMVDQSSAATARILNASSARLTHVVVEDFIVRSGSQERNLLTPVRLSSGLFNELHASSGFPIHWNFQSAADAKGTVDDDMLKSMGLYFKGQQHARDAARHLVRFLRGYRRALTAS